MRTPSLVLMVAGLAVTSAAQAVKYNYEYKCPETVVVRYCRNDEGQKVNELDNHCMVEYPDRPRSVARIPFFRSVVKNDLAIELKNCKGPAASDPAVAAAQAAKVDTTVFGIQLGDPFSLPACPMFQIGAAGRQTCYSAMVDQVGAIARQTGGPNAMPANVKTVYLAADNCPAWVNECMLVVQSFEGKVGYIGVFTKGPGVDAAVREALTEKYGRWHTSKVGTVTPRDAGRRVFDVVQLFWTLPGLYVNYQPVWYTAEGATPDVNEGLIRIETESARKARAADDAKRPKPKM